jgi:hypothetical protein
MKITNLLYQLSLTNNGIVNIFFFFGINNNFFKSLLTNYCAIQSSKSPIQELPLLATYWLSNPLLVLVLVLGFALS